MHNTQELRDVVLLVHGTWGRGFFGSKAEADWCERDSPCATAIREALGPNTVIEVFRWSGRNNASARRQATKELLAHIERLASVNRDARLHVVAHSHGGNIAMYAAKRGAKFASLTCFSTPFLLVEERAAASGLFQGWTRMKSVGALLFLLPLLVVVWVMSYLLSGPNIAYLLGGLYLVGAVPFLVAGWMSSRTGKRVATLLEDLALPEKSAVTNRVLLIRAPGDEASAVLSMAQFFSRFFAVVSRGLLYWRSVSLVMRLFWAIAMILLPGGFLYFADQYIFPSAQMVESDVVGVIVLCLYGAVASAIIALLIPQFLLLLIAPLIGATCILSTFFLLPFGPLFAANSWRLEVASEPTPPGEWSVVQLTAGQSPGLRHGTHSDPRALEVLSRWLRSNFNESV